MLNLNTRALHVCGRNVITGFTSAASPRVDITSTCKVGQKLRVSLALLTWSPSAWPFRLLYRRGPEIPKGPMNYPVVLLKHIKISAALKLQSVTKLRYYEQASGGSRRWSPRLQYSDIITCCWVRAIARLRRQFTRNRIRAKALLGLQCKYFTVWKCKWPRPKTMTSWQQMVRISSLI